MNEILNYLKELLDVYSLEYERKEASLEDSEDIIYHLEEILDHDELDYERISKEEVLLVKNRFVSRIEKLKEEVKELKTSIDEHKKLYEVLSNYDKTKYISNDELRSIDELVSNMYLSQDILDFYFEIAKNNYEISNNRKAANEDKNTSVKIGNNVKEFIKRLKQRNNEMYEGLPDLKQEKSNYYRLNVLIERLLRGKKVSLDDRMALGKVDWNAFGLSEEELKEVEKIEDSIAYNARLSDYQLQILGKIRNNIRKEDSFVEEINNNISIMGRNKTLASELLSGNQFASIDILKQVLIDFGYSIEESIKLIKEIIYNNNNIDLINEEKYNELVYIDSSILK